MTDDVNSQTHVLQVENRHVLLFVDDEIAILRSLERLFKGEPYTIHITTNPREALDLVLRTRVHLVVSDHRMPDIEGTELLTRIREVSPRTQCLLVTGFLSGEVAREAERRNLWWLIEKPWIDDQLRRTIRHLLREGDLLKNP